MSTAKMRALRQEAEQRPSISTYRALVKEEISYLAAQQPPSKFTSPRHEEVSDRKEQLQTLIKNLKQRQHSAASDMHAAVLNSGPTTAATPSALSSRGQGALSNNGTHPLTVAECAKYRAVWLGLLKDYAVRKHVLTHLLSYPAAEFKYADLGLVSHWFDTWGAFLKETDQFCRELRKIEQRVGGEGQCLPRSQEPCNLLDEVCRLQLQARSLVGRERYRRSAVSEDAVVDFMASQSQLMEWCAQQRATLDELDDVAGLDEFVTLLRHNTPVMDSNFMVLAEQAEVLAADHRVQDALQQANQAWVGLCYGAYERLREAARREHRSAAVEQHCARWSREVGPRVRDTLLKVNRFLREEETALAEVTDAAALLQRSEELLLDHDAHHVVCAHLSDYDVREDCLQPHIEALKTELESDMTSMVLSFLQAVDYEGRAVYKNRIEELREWIEVNSQKETYVKLLERLEGTREVIAEYADILFPDDNDT